MAATVYERDNSVGTGAVSLRYRNRAEITLLMWEEKSIQYSSRRCLCKSYPAVDPGEGPGDPAPLFLDETEA